MPYFSGLGLDVLFHLQYFFSLAITMFDINFRQASRTIDKKQHY